MAATKLKHRYTSKGVQVVQKSMDARVGIIERDMVRTDVPAFRAGDTLRVHVRIKEGDKERIQIFEGDVICISNKGVHKSFTVRKISHGVGVERIFLFSSPKIAKIEIAQEGFVRRAKLYYLRELEGRAARIRRKKVVVTKKSASA